MGLYILRKDVSGSPVNRHIHNGKSYQPGDVIEDDRDLAAMFPLKFELHQGPAPVAETAPKEVLETQTASPDRDAASGASEGEAEPDARGTDVTADFPQALEHGLNVFQSGTKKSPKFSVYDGDELLNDKPLKRADVDSFISESLD